MPIETRSVVGRRKLHFDSLNEIVTDADMLVSSPNTKILGNWPPEKLLTHLAMAINHSIDGIRPKRLGLFG